VFDPVELGKRVERIVCRNGERKYYRFRSTRFYGGCATADCVGCNLRCVYCWNWRINANPRRFGEFYTPYEVAGKLRKMATNKYRYVRVSGGEPTLCFQHLIDVIRMSSGFLFILETNGILLADEKNVERLSNFPNLYVRICLKGVDGESFSRVTGAQPEFFELQMEALNLLHEYGIETGVALPFNLFPPSKIGELQRKLLEISPRYVLELEPVLDYGGAYARIKRAGLRLYESFQF